jgi:dTDP-4-amino-4,6-dideoxygalactose transaminase
VTVPFVDLARQHDSIRPELEAALARVVANGDYILGEDVRLFEEEFAAYCGVGRCVGVGSGTAAILLALEALGVGAGDEVVVPANTFVASVFPILKLGATPVLVDCDEVTATLDPELVERALTPRTRAVLAVHLYGHPADVDSVLEVCRPRGIPLVEDACQAHGAGYRGRRAGALGRVAAFSFYPSKNLGALGDAGAVTTDDEELADRIALLRDLGQRRKYEHAVAGWNERLDTLQAAVLRLKLRRLDTWNELRRSRAERYAHALAGAGLVLPRAEPWAEHAWHLYVVRSPARDSLRSALGEAGVATGLHYPAPVHLQDALAALGHREGDFPAAEAWSREGLSLPMFAELEDEEIDRVAAAAARFEPASVR